LKWTKIDTSATPLDAEAQNVINFAIASFNSKSTEVEEGKETDKEGKDEGDKRCKAIQLQSLVEAKKRPTNEGNKEIIVRFHSHFGYFTSGYHYT